MRSIPKEIRKGLNSLIILVSWEVWKHRNSCVFENARPSTSLLLQTVADECSVWGMAGATTSGTPSEVAGPTSLGQGVFGRGHACCCGASVSFAV